MSSKLGVSNVYLFHWNIFKMIRARVSEQLQWGYVFLYLKTVRLY